MMHSRIVHLFDKDDPQGGITIAYTPVLSDSKGTPTGTFARVAVAYCHPNDRYSRKAGQTKALTNLSKGAYILLPVYAHGHPVRELKRIFSGM
jgi:hypothetical protein